MALNGTAPVAQVATRYDAGAFAPYAQPSSESAASFAAHLAAASAQPPAGNGLPPGLKAEADALAKTLLQSDPPVFGHVAAMAWKKPISDQEIKDRLTGIPGYNHLTPEQKQKVFDEVKENIPPYELQNPLPPEPSNFLSPVAHDAAAVYHAVTAFAGSAGSAVSHHVAEATGLGVAGVVAGGIVTGAIDVGGVAAGVAALF
jgi:hypothetical protein